jgi:hypothetical protein
MTLLRIGGKFTTVVIALADWEQVVFRLMTIQFSLRQMFCREITSAPTGQFAPAIISIAQIAAGRMYMEAR